MRVTEDRTCRYKHVLGEVGFKKGYIWKVQIWTLISFELAVTVMKSRTRLSDFPFTFHFHALEKEKATHSSVLAWRIPGTGEPGGLPSTGLRRVRHD